MTSVRARVCRSVHSRAVPQFVHRGRHATRSARNHRNFSCARRLLVTFDFPKKVTPVVKKRRDIMTQRVRFVLPLVVFLGLGIWLNPRPGQQSGSSAPPATPV